MTKEKTKKQLEKIQKEKLVIAQIVCVIGLFLFAVIFIQNIKADQIVHKFKSPSFSGVGTSSHYLTIENQESTRKEAIKEEIQAYKDELARDADNTTLARFVRNLESRIYAQLSRQMVEQLFGETPQKSGKLELEGNTIEYIVEAETITLTITDENGGKTEISVPVGDL